MNKQIRKAYYELHIAVFLFGFTAILGALIQLNELSIVWWRLLLTCATLACFPGLLSIVRRMSWKQLLQLAGIGAIVAAHWVTFYGAIKYSNVSIALSCFGTTSFFTSMIEPLLLRKRFIWYELLLGLLVVPGMYIIFSVTDISYTQGIIMGLISALLASLFSTLNKEMVVHHDPIHITFVELGSGLLFLSAIMPLYWKWLGDGTNLFWPTGLDFFYLFLLAVACTVVAYILSLRALKYVSAFAANLTINLEPIYGILMAWIFFQENKELSSSFYLGAGIILLAVFAHPLLNRIMNKRKPSGEVDLK